jgi:hypothetical protein
MPKTSPLTNLDEYALVADRITLFYEKHSTGRITTELISRDQGEITFKAEVFRNLEDGAPSATGWASEQIGDGDINTVACLENTETSAVGRALANLGFTASRLRPSAEEMIKAARARARAQGESREKLSANRYANHPLTARTVHEKRPLNEDLQARADMVADALQLLGEAEAAGLSASDSEAARQTLLGRDPSREEIERVERRVRSWLVQSRTPPAPPTSPIH